VVRQAVKEAFRVVVLMLVEEVFTARHLDRGLAACTKQAVVDRPSFNKAEQPREPVEPIGKSRRNTLNQPMAPLPAATSTVGYA
jgi:hypothetical protein